MGTLIYQTMRQNPTHARVLFGKYVFDLRGLLVALLLFYLSHVLGKGLLVCLEIVISFVAKVCQQEKDTDAHQAGVFAVFENADIPQSQLDKTLIDEVQG